MEHFYCKLYAPTLELQCNGECYSTVIRIISVSKATSIGGHRF